MATITLLSLSLPIPPSPMPSSTSSTMTSSQTNTSPSKPYLKPTLTPLPPSSVSQLRSELLSQIARLEALTFSPAEAIEFHQPLQNPKTTLLIVVDLSPPADTLRAAHAESNGRSGQLVRSLLPDTGPDPDSNTALPSPAPEQLQATAQTTIVPAPVSSSPESSPPTAIVAAYALLTLSAGACLLQRLVTREHYRRRGIAGELLAFLAAELEGSVSDRGLSGGGGSVHCEHIQSWLDWRREDALRVLLAASFRRVDAARDYFGKGRHAVKVVRTLGWVW